MKTDLRPHILVFLIFRAHFFIGFFWFYFCLLLFFRGLFGGDVFCCSGAFLILCYVFFVVWVCSLFCIEAADLFPFKFYFFLGRIFCLLGNEIFFSSKFPRFSSISSLNRCKDYIYITLTFLVLLLDPFINIFHVLHTSHGYQDSNF